MKETIATPSAPAAVNEVYARVFPRRSRRAPASRSPPSPRERGSKSRQSPHGRPELHRKVAMSNDVVLPSWA